MLNIDSPKSFFQSIPFITTSSNFFKMEDALTDVVPLVTELLEGAAARPLDLAKLILHFAIIVGVQYQPLQQRATI